MKMPSFFVLWAFKHLIFQKQIKYIAVSGNQVFQRRFRFAFWVGFFPSHHAKLLQSYAKVTFSSRALHPQKTLNSSFAFAIEHLHLG